MIRIKKTAKVSAFPLMLMLTLTGVVRGAYDVDCSDGYYLYGGYACFTCSQGKWLILVLAN